MITYTPEQFKEKYGQAGLDAVKVKKQEGFFANIKQKFNERVEKGSEAIAADQNIGSKILQTVGQGAGFIGDVAFEGVKAVTPEFIEKPVGEAVKAIGQTEPVQNIVEKVTAWAEQNPEAAKNLQAIVDIGSLIPIGKGAQVGTQVAKAGAKRTVNIAGDVIGTGKKITTETIEKIKPKITPEPKPLEAVGQVLQGQTKDIESGVKAISAVDTKGVKTFEDLNKKFDTKIVELAKKVDEELSVDTTPRKLNELIVTGKTKSGKTVKLNPVDDALKQLDELYTTTGDKVEAANIKELIAKAKNEGLTNLEINNLSRIYGKEFGSKAFGKTGEPLTSVNAQLYENTRKGIKEVARSGIKGKAAQKADKLMSNIYDTQRLIKKNVEAVNKLKQRIQERGLLEKFGHAVSKYADILTGGTIRGLIGGLLPRGAGYKVLNALDLEEALSKNLQLIEKAIKSGNDADIKKILDRFK